MQPKTVTSIRAFTLIEVLITILIITALLALAIPNFLSSRNRAQTNTCLTNLEHISRAKEQFTAEARKQNGDSAEWSDLVPHFIKHKPACPAGGDYTIETIGTDPKCSVSGHVIP